MIANIKSPGDDYYLRRVNSPVVTDTGVKGNGVNSLLDPKITLGFDVPNFTRDDAHLSVFGKIVNSDGWLIMDSSTGNNRIFAANTTLHRINGTSLSVDALGVNRFINLNKTGNLATGNLNGSQVSTVNALGNIQNNSIYFLGAVTSSGVQGSTTSEASFFSIGRSLQSFASAYNSRVQTLMNNLNVI